MLPQYYLTFIYLSAYYYALSLLICLFYVKYKNVEPQPSMQVLTTIWIFSSSIDLEVGESRLKTQVGGTHPWSPPQICGALIKPTKVEWCITFFITVVRNVGIFIHLHSV